MTIVTIVELFDEYSVPFSPEVIRSLIMTPTDMAVATLLATVRIAAVC